MAVKEAVLIVSAIALSGCSTIEERDAHMRGQIEIVKVQKDSETTQKTAEANARARLYEALAAVALANPEQASAVTVALAVQGVSSEGASNNSKIVPLQPFVNEKLEFAKAFAAPLANVTTAVATAYINADVAKTQSNNAARVQINDALQDSKIVESVADVGIAAAEAGGLFVSGDNYTLSDMASISQDSFSTVETTTTTTETNTETNTSSSIADSYNPETTNTTTDTTNTTDSYNDMSDNTDNSYVTYGGEQMTLAQLVTFLQESGEPYSFSLGEDIYTDDTTDETNSGYTCIPTFEGYVCSGGEE
jgi:hypothetical protein